MPKIAESLEERGLYRRAATRWREVMLLCTEDDDREWVKQRHDMCLDNVKRPPVKAENGGKRQRQTTSGGDGSQ